MVEHPISPKVASVNPVVCVSCGAPTPSGLAFCPACGTPLRSGGEQTAPEASDTGLPSSPLPSLPPAPTAVDPFDLRARSKRARDRSTPIPRPHGEVAEVPTPGRPGAGGRLWLAVGAAVIVVGLGAAVVLSARGSGGGATTEVATRGETGGAAVAPATTASASASSGLRYRHHVGRSFEVEVPDAWQTTYTDRLTNRNPESRVSRWEDPFRAVLAITTSRPIDGTPAEVCAEIYDDRVPASVILTPEMTEVRGRRTCSFAYRRSDGQVRVERLFVMGDRVFLVTVGAADRDTATEIADGAVATLELH